MVNCVEFLLQDVTCLLKSEWISITYSRSALSCSDLTRFPVSHCWYGTAIYYAKYHLTSPHKMYPVHIAKHITITCLTWLLKGPLVQGCFHTRGKTILSNSQYDVNYNICWQFSQFSCSYLIIFSLTFWMRVLHILSFPDLLIFH